MAKLHGKAKAAFLRRMAKGRARKRGGSHRSRKRRTGRRAPRVSLIPLSNPGRSRARHGTGGGFASRAIALVIPRAGGKQRMKHRKHRKSSRRRHHRNPGALMVNPRRGRRRHRIGRRRRGNPGAIREGIGLVLRSLIPAIVGGGLLGFLDAKFGTGRGTAIRTIGKGVFAGLVGVLGQKYLGKTGAGVAVGAVLGSIGYEGGFRLGGGVVAGSKPAALRELMADPGDDQEVRAAMGLLEPSQPGMGDQMGQSYEQAITAGIGESYQSALDTNYAAQGVGDDMGDDD